MRRRKTQTERLIESAFAYEDKNSMKRQIILKKKNEGAGSSNEKEQLKPNENADQSLEKWDKTSPKSAAGSEKLEHESMTRNTSSNSSEPSPEMEGEVGEEDYIVDEIRDHLELETAFYVREYLNRNASCFIPNFRTEPNLCKYVYRVHWEGYTSEDDTWEPETNLYNSDEDVPHDELLKYKKQNSLPMKLEKIVKYFNWTGKSGPALTIDDAEIRMEKSRTRHLRKLAKNQESSQQKSEIDETPTKKKKKKKRTSLQLAAVAQTSNESNCQEPTPIKSSKDVIENVDQVATVKQAKKLKKKNKEHILPDSNALPKPKAPLQQFDSSDEETLSVAKHRQLQKKEKKEEEDRILKKKKKQRSNTLLSSSDTDSVADELAAFRIKEKRRSREEVAREEEERERGLEKLDNLEELLRKKLLRDRKEPSKVKKNRSVVDEPDQHEISISLEKNENEGDANKGKSEYNTADKISKTTDDIVSTEVPNTKKYLNKNSAVIVEQPSTVTLLEYVVDTVPRRMYGAINVTRRRRYRSAERGLEPLFRMAARDLAAEKLRRQGDQMIPVIREALKDVPRSRPILSVAHFVRRITKVEPKENIVEKVVPPKAVVTSAVPEIIKWFGSLSANVRTSIRMFHNELRKLEIFEKNKAIIMPLAFAYTTINFDEVRRLLGSVEDYQDRLFIANHLVMEVTIPVLDRGGTKKKQGIWRVKALIRRQDAKDRSECAHEPSSHWKCRLLFAVGSALPGSHRFSPSCILDRALALAVTIGSSCTTFALIAMGAVIKPQLYLEPRLAAKREKDSSKSEIEPDDTRGIFIGLLHKMLLHETSLRTVLLLLRMGFDPSSLAFERIDGQRTALTSSQVIKRIIANRPDFGDFLRAVDSTLVAYQKKATTVVDRWIQLSLNAIETIVKGRLSSVHVLGAGLVGDQGLGVMLYLDGSFGEGKQHIQLRSRSQSVAIFVVSVSSYGGVVFEEEVVTEGIEDVEDISIQRERTANVKVSTACIAVNGGEWIELTAVPLEDDAKDAGVWCFSFPQDSPYTDRIEWGRAEVRFGVNCPMDQLFAVCAKLVGPLESD